MLVAHYSVRSNLHIFFFVKCATIFVARCRRALREACAIAFAHRTHAAANPRLYGKRRARIIVHQLDLSEVRQPMGNRSTLIASDLPNWRRPIWRSLEKLLGKFCFIYPFDRRLKILKTKRFARLSKISVARQLWRKKFRDSRWLVSLGHRHDFFCLLCFASMRSARQKTIN